MNDRLRISLRNPLIQRLRRHSQMAILFRASQSSKGSDSRVIQPLQANLPGSSETDFGQKNPDHPILNEEPEVTPNLDKRVTKVRDQQAAAYVQRTDTAPVKVAVPGTQPAIQRPGIKEPPSSNPEETTAISDKNWKRLQTILQLHKEKEEASSLAEGKSGNQEKQDVIKEDQSRTTGQKLNHIPDTGIIQEKEIALPGPKQEAKSRPPEEPGISPQSQSNTDVVSSRPETGRKYLKSRVIELETPNDFQDNRNQVNPESRTLPFEKQVTSESEAQSNDSEAFSNPLSAQITSQVPLESTAETGGNKAEKRTSTIPEIATSSPDQARHENIRPAANMPGSSKQPGIQRLAKPDENELESDLEDHSSLKPDEANTGFPGDQHTEASSTIPKQVSSDVEQVGVSLPDRSEVNDFGPLAPSALQPIPLQSAWPVQRREEQSPDADILPQAPIVEDGSQTTGPAQDPSEAMSRLQLNSSEEVHQRQTDDDNTLIDRPAPESTESPGNSMGGLQPDLLERNLHQERPFGERIQTKELTQESSDNPSQPLGNLQPNSPEHDLHQGSSLEDRILTNRPGQDLSIQREIFPDEISQPGQINGEESPVSVAQTFPDNPSQRENQTTPRLVQTEIGWLPDDLWNMLEEEPPDSGTQQASGATPAPPESISGSTDNFPPIPASAGMIPESIQRERLTEDFPEEAASPSALQKANPVQEADIVELASRVYAEIRNRISIEWERLRSR